MNNLFTNAIEHSEENSTIKAILSEKNGEIYFKISNESKNFSEENLKDIIIEFDIDKTFIDNLTLIRCNYKDIDSDFYKNISKNIFCPNPAKGSFMGHYFC